MRLFSGLIILVILFACGAEEEVQSEFKHPDEIYNPNGDSELSIVMRNLHYQADKIRMSLEKGEEADYSEFRKLSDLLTTAVPTDSNVLDEKFYLMSGLLQKQVTALVNSENPSIEFDGLVSACVACHRNTCPGPIGKINKLRMKS